MHFQRAPLACVAAFVCFVLVACTRRIPEGALPDAVLSGTTLTGAEAEEAFSHWAENVASDARLPIHLVYDVRLEGGTSAAQGSVEGDGAADFALEAVFTMTLLDEHRGRFHFDGQVQGPGDS